jgi:oligoendopeptidase F
MMKMYRLMALIMAGGMLMTVNAQAPVFESRDAVPAEFQWKLTDIFPSDSEWEKTYTETVKLIPACYDHAGKFTRDHQSLKNFLDLYTTLSKNLDKLYGYAHMKSDQDVANPHYQGMVARMRSVYADFGQAVAFFEPEVMLAGKEKIDQLLQVDQGLAHYQHFFYDILRLRKHTLSADMEKLLAMSGPATSGYSTVYGMMNNVDFEFPEMQDEKGQTVKITHGIYGKFMQSPDRRVRKDVYLGIHKPYMAFRNTLASNYNGMINVHIFSAKARNYDNTRLASLNRNAIPESIYQNLIESVNANLQPLHRYVGLRKKLLKLDDGVHDYDLRAAMFPTGRSTYEWDDAKELMVKGLAKMGPEYIAIMADGMDNGWIDVYENKGKRSGAYSSSAYGTHPYVLMNYNGSLNDVFTLAHEMGHAMHTYYSMQEQPYVYADYSIFVAEVASTLNEALLMDYMLTNAKSKSEKLSLINYMLTNFARTYYRQTIFAEFEYESHKLVEENKPINAETLENLFGEIYARYQGPDFVLDDATKSMWSRIPHFYYNYYVYQYATSFAASQALAAKILNDEKGALENYYKLLRGGSHVYPVDLLTEAGADLTTPAPFEATAVMMNKYLDELEKLLDE